MRKVENSGINPLNIDLDTIEDEVLKQELSQKQSSAGVAAITRILLDYKKPAFDNLFMVKLDVILVQSMCIRLVK